MAGDIIPKVEDFLLYFLLPPNFRRQDYSLYINPSCDKDEDGQGFDQTYQCRTNLLITQTWT